jgi:hypothetical protein
MNGRVNWRSPFRNGGLDTGDVRIQLEWVYHVDVLQGSVGALLILPPALEPGWR